MGGGTGNKATNARELHENKRHRKKDFAFLGGGEHNTALMSISNGTLIILAQPYNINKFETSKTTSARNSKITT